MSIPHIHKHNEIEIYFHRYNFCCLSFETKKLISSFDPHLYPCHFWYGLCFDILGNVKPYEKGFSFQQNWIVSLVFFFLLFTLVNIWIDDSEQQTEYHQPLHSMFSIFRLTMYPIPVYATGDLFYPKTLGFFLVSGSIYLSMPTFDDFRWKYRIKNAFEK